MIHDQLIAEFLDSGLDETREQMLFDELAARPELRGELAGQVKMDTAMRADLTRVQVPEDANTGLFGALGFSQVSAPLAAVTPVAAGYGASHLFSVGIVTAGLTALIMWLLLGTSPTQLATTAGISSPSLSLSSPNPATSLQQSTPIAPVNTIGKDRTIIKYITKYVQSGPTDEEIETIVAGRVEKELADRDASRVISDDNQITSSTPVPPIIDHSDVIAVPGPIVERNDEVSPLRETDWGIHIRSTPTRSFSSINSIGDNLAVKNLAIAVLHEFDGGEHFAGVEVGYENFGQQFDRKENGVVNSFTQNPTLYYGGAAYRFAPHIGIAEIIRPYAEVVLGATVVGPLTKGIIGISYQPETMVELQIGWDMSALVYGANSGWKVSRKAGFTYGVGVKF